MRTTDMSDRGETLTELLVSISIVGIAVVAILGTIGMTSSASGIHRDQATVQNTLHNWAEQLSDATYTPCATTAQARSAVTPTLPDGYTGLVTAVRYWHGADFAANCGTDSGLQRITLSVTSGSAPVAAGTLDVVVRKPCESGC